MKDRAEFYAEVGRRIRSAREARGLTQASLATLVSLTRASVTNIEGGRQKILLHTLLDIASALQVEPAGLYPGRAATPDEDIDELLRDHSATTRNWVTSAVSAGRHSKQSAQKKRT